MHNVLLVVLVFWCAFAWARAELGTALLTTVCVMLMVLLTPATWLSVGLVFMAAGAGAAFSVWGRRGF